MKKITGVSWQQKIRKVCHMINILKKKLFDNIIVTNYLLKFNIVKNYRSISCEKKSHAMPLPVEKKYLYFTNNFIHKEFLIIKNFHETFSNGNDENKKQ